MAAASPKQWKLTESEIETGAQGDEVWVAHLTAEPADAELIVHSREDLEYLLDLIEAMDTAMTERVQEANHWKSLAIGGEGMRLINESNYLKALVGREMSEAFISDEEMATARDTKQIALLYDGARAGTLLVVT